MPKTSVKFKIIFSICTIIFIIGAIVAYVVFFESRNMMVEIKRQSITKANVELANNISHLFQDSSRFIKAIAERDGVKNLLKSNIASDTAKTSDLLTSYASDHPEYLAIYLMDTQGICIVSTDKRFIGQNYKFREYFKSALQGNPYAEVAVGKTSNELGYYFSHPVLSMDNTVSGAVVAKLNPKYIEASLKNTELAKEGAIMFANKDGVVLYSQKPGRLLHSLGPLNEKEKNEIQKEQKFSNVTILPLQYGTAQISIRSYSKPISFDFYDATDKETEIVGVTKIEPYQFFIVSEFEISELVIGSVRLATILGMGVFLAAMLVTLVIVVLINEYLRPLEAITNFAQKISEGDFTHSISITSRDEFQVLAKTLNKMTVRLRELYQNMESKINDQTKELTDEVQQLEKARAQTAKLLKEVEIKRELSEQQAEELRKYQLAVDNASDHIVITNSEGIILYANKAVERITGFSKKEILGTKAGVLWGKLMPINVYKELWDKIKIHKTSFQGEFNNRRKNGEKYIAEAKVSPILDDLGNVIFFVGIERDVTKIREIDRMKTEFISLASHQLRTPLSAVKWFIEMLLAGDIGKLSTEQREIMNNINESNERMIDLVNTLLDVSRIESGRLLVDAKPTNLQKLLEDVISDVGVSLRNNNQVIKIEIPKSLPEVSIDPKLIRQVYMNFLTNSIKYSPKNTTITLKVTFNSKEVVSEVRDEGYGIPLADQDKIFRRFYRAPNVSKQESDGNGLGLYLVKSIIESSGGRVWFESIENKGTSFFFTIPVLDS